MAEALNEPNDIVVDAAGNLFISDTLNNRVRRVSAAGIISTVAGSGLNPFTKEFPSLEDNCRKIESVFRVGAGRDGQFIHHQCQQ